MRQVTLLKQAGTDQKLKITGTSGDHLIYAPYSVKGRMIIWPVNHSSQFCIVYRLAEGTFYLIIQIVGEDVEQYWNQYRPMWDTPRWMGFQLDVIPLITML